jgi:DNA-binding Xre family transcriptional regulator
MNQGQKRKPRGFLATDDGIKRLEDERIKKGYTYESLAEAAEVNDDQVKRLFNPHWGVRVQRNAIEKIAKKLDLRPTDIVNYQEWYWNPPSKLSASGQVIYSIQVKGTKDAIIPSLDDFQNRVRQISADTLLQIEIVVKGSVVIVMKGSLEGFKRLETMFKSGQLTEILGFAIEDVHLGSVIETAAPVNLSEWFQNNFIEAIQAGWQTITEIFSRRTLTPAFRSNAVQRAKQIQLGDRTLALILDLEVVQSQQISIFIGVYPLSKETYLPEDIKIVVFFDSGEPLEIPVNDNLQGFSQEILFFPGEQFSVQVTSGDDTVIEYFVI